MRWKIGDVIVTKVVESEIARELPTLLPLATRKALLQLSWLKPHFMTEDGDLRLSFHALVIETPTRKILVDACVGNDKSRPSLPMWDKLQLPFLRDLEAAGYPRHSIDTVLCTHLHVDHVGWNTMLVDGRWLPTFPNARYLIGRTEFEHSQVKPIHDGAATNHISEAQGAAMEDSVKPVLDAGLVDLVETDHRLTDEVWLMPSPGHTSGHVSVAISSRGSQALITGDFVHHPCQLAHPEWATTIDHDARESTATRERIFGFLAGTPTLVIGSHWAGATAGQVVRDGAAFRLVI
jgi:glyoxylase-like metal-dependent hydrolase (beta-lactamase superfamily II)